MKKKTKHKLESPLSKIAVNCNPCFITLLSIVVMLISAYFITQAKFELAGLVFAVAVLMDAYDGVVARKFKRVTNFGAFFDRTADRINDVIPIIAIIAVGFIDVRVGLLVLFFVLLASYESATLEVITKSRIGDEFSLRPFRSIVLFLAIFTAYISVFFIALMSIAMFSVLYRFYKANIILSKMS